MRAIPQCLRKLLGHLCVSCVLLVGGVAFAEGPDQSKLFHGYAVGAFISQPFGGAAGPETLLSRTDWDDVFDTGGGLRFELFREQPGGWRGQVGLVYSGWDGKFFVGGVFPAGAQFSDFSLYGAYLGGTALLNSTLLGYQPYFLGNLGLVHLSSVTAVTGGMTIPYWSGNWRDYLELGAGLRKKLNGGTLTLDLRLQVFGKPESANYPISAATGGQSLLLGIGYEWGRR